MGRVGKAETETRARQVELKYLESLQNELTARIIKIKTELAEEPSREAKKMFQKLYEEARKPVKTKRKKHKKTMQVETAVRP